MSGLSKPNPTPGSFKALIPVTEVAKAVVAPIAKVIAEAEKKSALSWLWPFGKKGKS